MTKQHSKSGNALNPSKKYDQSHHDWIEVSNRLYDLTCISQFYHSVIQAAMYYAQHEDAIDFNTEWQHGLFLVGEWIDQEGVDLVTFLNDMKRPAKG